MNLAKKFPVRNIKNIKKYVELLNIKLKNGEFKLTYRSCICCKQNSEKILFNNDRYGINLKILMCKVCGFVYQNPRIDEESLIKFYESDLYRDIHSSVDNYQYKWKLAKSYKKKKLQLQNYDPFGFVDFIEESKIKYKSVFEIGAAGGANLLPFKGLNKQVGGNELSKKLIKFANTKGIKLLYSNLDSIPLNIDLLIIQHVLEHLFDPEKLLRHIYKKNVNYLYIGVPGFVNVMPKVQLAHNFYFSFNTLISICVRNGFKPIKKAIYNSNNYLMVLFERQNKIEEYEYNYSSEVKNITKIYNNFRIKTFLLPIYKFLKINKINEKFRK